MAKKRASAAQLKARANFAAMSRKRAKAARAGRTTSSGGSVAKRRRKRSSGTAVVRRRSSGTVRHKKRRSGRRRLRRNPNVVAVLTELAKDTAYGLGGYAAGNFVSQKAVEMMKLQSNKYAKYAIGGGVAVLIRLFGSKLLGHDGARMAAQGAALGVSKDFVVEMLPESASVLGNYSLGNYSLGANVMPYTTRIGAGNRPALPGAQLDRGLQLDALSSYPGNDLMPMGMGM